MDNGNGERPPQPNVLALVPPNVVVTPENYMQHLQQLQHVKERIAQYEQDLQAGYQRYLAQEEELKKRVEAGRQAEQLLAQMRGAGNVAPAGPSSHARPPSYPSASNPQGSTPSTSMFHTFPVANPHYNQQTQPAAMAYNQQNPTTTTTYGQYAPLPPPYQQHAAQYGNGWSQYVVNQQGQPSQPVGHAQGPAGSSQSQQRVPAPPPPNRINGSGQTQATTAGPSGQQQQPHGNHPDSSGRGFRAPVLPGQNSTPDDIKRATAVYVSQSQQQDQKASATTAYQNVYGLLKELRPEMVDYIIFSALDSLRNKLPSGAISGQHAFLKVREQLPAHSVEQLAQISNYVVQQLEALEPGAIKAIVVRIKQSVMQHVAKQRWQAQQAAASAQGGAGPQHQSAPPQPPDVAGNTIGRPQTAQFGKSIATSGPVNATAAVPRLPTAAAAGPPPSKQASPPSLASALGHNANVKAESPSLSQKAAPSSSSQTTGPSQGTQIQFQDIPGSSPSRRTIIPLNRAPAQSPPHGPKPTSSGPGATSSDTNRPKSPWTPAKADKARLAQAIMQSLGRPSRSSASQSPARPPPSTSQDPVAEDSAANKRKRTPSVTDSPSQKKQKVGIEVEEIATDGAFELAVWQQQSSDRISVAGSETDSLQKPGPSDVPGEPIPVQGVTVTEGLPVHEPQVDSGVGDVGSAPALIEGAFAPPMPFPTIDECIGISLPERREETQAPLPDAGDTVPPPIPPIQEAAPTPASVGTAPPTSRTASPPSDAKTPIAESGPAPTKTPLFFPSPASERGDDVRGGNVSDQEEERDPAEVFASAFSANANLVTSPYRIPTRAKGKGRMVVNDSEDEDGRSVSSKPKAQKKQRAIDSDSDLETMDRSLSSQRKPSRAVQQPIIHQAYVLVPRMPQWAKKLREKEKEEERQKPKRMARKMSTPETVPESVDELAVDDEPDQARLQEEQAQQEVVRLAVTRLHESRCLWRGCDAILNSTESLTRHVHCHAEGSKDAGAFFCEWRGCNRVFNSPVVLAHHLVRHASATLFCAFEGCEKSFATPKDLFRHHTNGRHRIEQLKPLNTPYKPETLPAIPPLPSDMPPYMQVPCPVTRHPVSRVVHQWLSAKVLEDISSFRFAGRRMHHNAPSRSSRRLADKIAAVEKEGKTPAAKVELLRRLNDDEYEQVGNGRELKPAMRCADIPSGEVTRLLENGYVMFPPPGWVWEGDSDDEDDDDDDADDDGVEIKSEPHPIELLQLHGDPRSEDGHAALDGQVGETSRSGARVEVATSTAAGRDDVAGGATSTQVRQKSPLPGWEVLPGASQDSRRPSTDSTQPGDRAGECVMS